jgi:hypothetical protein
MSIARDGTGGLVFLEQIGGVAHVFVSTLAQGQFQPPQQVDTGALVGGSASQPVIAAGSGGVLLVAFVSDGQLYVADRASSTAAWQAPLALHPDAANPSLQLSDTDGKAYLAFTAGDGGGQDVLVDYYDAGRWTPAQGPLNLTAADDAGTGAGRPAVAAAGDGVGMVVWGEGGHLYFRRVWGVSPSTEIQQLDAAPASLPGYGAGWAEISVGDAALATQGNSSYAEIAFDETARSPGGAVTQTRVLLARMVAEHAVAAVPVDGLSAASGDAAAPAVAVNEFGRGFVTAAQTQSGDLFAGQLSTDGVLTGLGRLNSVPNGAPPQAAPGIAGLNAMLIAWPRTTPTGVEIRLRYAPAPGELGPEQIASAPPVGPTDAVAGLVSGGDRAGDAAVAWLQGSAGQREIVTAQLFVPPSAPAPKQSFSYSRSAEPVLSWSPGRDAWGPLTYAVSIDGVQVARTQSTSMKVPIPLTDGPHGWQVTAINLGGAGAAGARSTVWVDTLPPRFEVALGGRDRIGSRVRATVIARDLPAPDKPGAQASGLAQVVIRWGDGSKSNGRSASHAYVRAGLFRVKVTATDRAGNQLTIARYLRILP